MSERFIDSSPNNNLTFDMSKTKVILFNTKHKYASIKLCLGGNMLKIQDNVTYLGVIGYFR